MENRLPIVCACMMLMACGPSQTQSQPPRPIATGETEQGGHAGEPVSSEPSTVQVSLAEVGLDPAAMDPDADPCSDFFQYSCGGWLKATEIPEDRARYGRFTEIAERNEDILKRILEGAPKAPGTDPASVKLGRFYGACMDEQAIEKAGLSGIEPLLARARAVKRSRDVPGVITELHGHGIWAVFQAMPEPDFKNSTQNILFIDTAGLGLPDRDYYLKDEPSFVKARDFYRGHVQRMFQLAGAKKGAAKRAARDVLDIETELARVTRTKAERNNLPKLYNKIDHEGLQKLMPSFDWSAYLAAFDQADLQDISVTTPDYHSRLETMLATVKPGKWSHYLQWQILHQMASTLPKAFVDEDFALVRILTDQPRIRPRWKRCIDATDRALGELLGQRYVAERFAGSSKNAAELMVREIRAAFATAVAELPWMAAATREKALAKLARMAALIGYPETWKTYDFAIDPDNYAKSVLAARAFDTRRELAKADQPFDRNEWHMLPHTVNAYYSPLANQMVFPAGILQTPFFAAERSVAANLGAIGMVVGHELTHGFDDSGARFDAVGNMVNWWQDADAKKFEEKGQCLVKQYSEFEPLPGLKLNGQLTLGENIADLGGIKLAFRAYRNLRKDADKRYVADGLTEDQQFFVAAGQAWCTKMREAEERRRVVVDSHSPPHFRVNGSLRNTPEFAEAFQCKEGTPMHPKNTCEVW